MALHKTTPSIDYAKVYGEIHETKPKHWAGTTVRKYIPIIKELVAQYKPTRMLDYGCGKGYQYLAHRIHEQWGGILPYCYDVGVRQLSGKPEGKFQGLICTDVLEHVEEQDADDIIADALSFLSSGFAFFSISCRPCKDIILPDGRNGHINQQTPEWWSKKFEKHLRPQTFLVRLAFDV